MQALHNNDNNNAICDSRQLRRILSAYIIILGNVSIRGTLIPLNVYCSFHFATK